MNPAYILEGKKKKSISKCQSPVNKDLKAEIGQVTECEDWAFLKNKIFVSVIHACSSKFKGTRGHWMKVSLASPHPPTAPLYLTNLFPPVEMTANAIFLSF